MLSSACEGVGFAIGSVVTVAIEDAAVFEVGPLSSTLGDASEVAVTDRVLCLVDEGKSDAFEFAFELIEEILFPSSLDVDSVVCGTSVAFVLDALSVLVLIIGLSVAEVTVAVSVPTGLDSELSREEVMTVAADEDTSAEGESGVDVDTTVVLVVLTVLSAVSLFEGDEVWSIVAEVEVVEAIMSVVLAEDVATVEGVAATVLSVGVSVVIGVKVRTGGEFVGVSEPAFEDDELGGSCGEVEGEVMGEEDEEVGEGKGKGRCEELVGGFGEAVGFPSTEEEVTGVSGEDVEMGMVEESVWESGPVDDSSPRPVAFPLLDVPPLLVEDVEVRVGASSEDEVEETEVRMVKLSPVDSTGREVDSDPLLVCSDDEEWTEVVERLEVVFKLTEDEVVDDERKVPVVKVGLDMDVDVDRSLVDGDVVLLSVNEEAPSDCVEGVVPILDLELAEEDTNIVDVADAVEGKVTEELDKATDDTIVVDGDTDDIVSAEVVPAEIRTGVLVLMEEDDDLVLSVATASDEVNDNDITDVADETASEVENRTALEEKLDEAVSELVDRTAPEDTDEDASAKLVDAGRVTKEDKSAEDDGKEIKEMDVVEDEGEAIEVVDVCENEDEKKLEVEVEIGETFVVLEDSKLEDEMDDEVLDRDEDEERDEPCVPGEVAARDVVELILFSPGELEAVTARQAYGIACKCKGRLTYTVSVHQ